MAEIRAEAQMERTPRAAERAASHLDQPERARQFLSHPVLRLQRVCGNHYLQRALAPSIGRDGLTEVSSEVGAAIDRARGGGQPLDSAVRSRLEPAFDADFSTVRAHTDREAHELSRSLGARAFTVGNDIFFGEGEFNPASSAGLHLLAHELTHVVQQAGHQMQRKLRVSQPSDASEQEADRIAERVTGGGLVSQMTAGGLADAELQRQPSKHDPFGPVSEQLPVGEEGARAGFVPVGRTQERREAREEEGAVQRMPLDAAPRAEGVRVMPVEHAPTSVQRTIDTSILLTAYQMSGLTAATLGTGSPYREVFRGMQAEAYGNFAEENYPVLDMQVTDTWYYYNPAFTNSIYATRSWWVANLIPENGYWRATDAYQMNFRYRHTATRGPRPGSFQLNRGRTHSVTKTTSGGAKLTYKIIEVSGSVSRAETRGTTSGVTVTIGEVYEHDYAVTVDWSLAYFNDSDFRVDRGFWGPEIRNTGGPHNLSGTISVGTITVFDDDSNPDNLTP